MSHLIKIKNSSHYGGVFDTILVLQEVEGTAIWERDTETGGTSKKGPYYRGHAVHISMKLTRHVHRQ